MFLVRRKVVKNLTNDGFEYASTVHRALMNLHTGRAGITRHVGSLQQSLPRSGERSQDGFAA